MRVLLLRTLCKYKQVYKEIIIILFCSKGSKSIIIDKIVTFIIDFNMIRILTFSCKSFNMIYIGYRLKAGIKSPTKNTGKETVSDAVLFVVHFESTIAICRANIHV